MRQRTQVSRFRAAATRFLRDRKGLSAVEFAIMLPFMLLMYLGAFEVCQGIATQRMVTLTAATVANLTTQYASISQSAEMPDVLNASAIVMTPYPSGPAVVTVSLVSIDKSGNATVAWSQSLHGAPRAVGSPIAVPAGLNVPNTNLVFGETSYPYVPLMDFLKLGTMNLYSSVFMLPRSSSGNIILTP
jgi:Flp pilus assembly protein TadG